MGRGQVRVNLSERPLRDPEQIARMLSPNSKHPGRANQIIWRGNKRPMLLKVCPYFEYMPWWYYSRDRRFPEKFNRWIWRRGKDDIVPPDIPPKKPPKPPEPPKPPQQTTHRPDVVPPQKVDEDRALINRFFGENLSNDAPPAPVSGFKIPERIGPRKVERIMPEQPVNGTETVPG